MSKPAEIVTRETGERVTLSLGLEPTSVKELGEGVFEAIITTSATDRQNEQIVTEGIDTSNYMDNPAVLYGHDYWGLPIGKATKLTQMKNKIKAQFQLAVEEYPFAATVAAMIKGGYLNAVSIGGIVREWSEDYRTIMKMEMVEFSIVPVPANPQALITARSLEEATGKSIEEIETEYRDFAHKSPIDSKSEIDDDDVKQAIGLLQKQVATLQEAAVAAASAGKSNEVRRIKRVTLRRTAQAAATQAQQVIKVIKLKSKEL